MKEETQEWLKFASRDVLACKKLVKENSLASISAFHSQQAVEKSFKAVLVEHGLKVPKIHSVVSLYRKISDLIELELNIATLETIEEIYIDTRYPGDVGLLPGGEPDVKTAEELCNFAAYVYDAIVTLLSVKE